MPNIPTMVVQEILEGLHDFTGNDFSFRHNDENRTLEATHYTPDGEVDGVYGVVLILKVEKIG